MSSPHIAFHEKSAIFAGVHGSEIYSVGRPPWNPLAFTDAQIMSCGAKANKQILGWGGAAFGR